MIVIGDKVKFNNYDGDCVGEVVSIKEGKITMKLDKPIQNLEAPLEMFKKI